MDFDRRSNDLAAEAVRFHTMDALQRTFTEGSEENEVCNLICGLRYLRFLLLVLIAYGPL